MQKNKKKVKENRPIKVAEGARRIGDCDSHGPWARTRELKWPQMLCLAYCEEVIALVSRVHSSGLAQQQLCTSDFGKFVQTGFRNLSPGLRKVPHVFFFCVFLYRFSIKFFLFVFYFLFFKYMLTFSKYKFKFFCMDV